jgi:hypothetical protein
LTALERGETFEELLMVRLIDDSGLLATVLGLAARIIGWALLLQKLSEILPVAGAGAILFKALLAGAAFF